MAKRRFIKSIQKSSPFKKLSVTFISLALLFILSIILYFVFNKYSVENFTPKANARIEVILWTDDEGSVNNKFVTDEWIDIVTTYSKFAKFDKGDFAGFKNYLRNGFKGTDKEQYTTDANLDQLKTALPLVTVSLIVDNKIDGDLGLITCDPNTGTFIKNRIATYSSKDYNKLYSNSTSSEPSMSSELSTSSELSMPSTPSMPSMPSTSSRSSITGR